MAKSASANEGNVRLIFSERSHLSGVSIRMDLNGYKEGEIILELHEVGDNFMHPLRSVTIDMAVLEADEMEHVYWEPVETSKGRYFLLYARFSPDCWQPGAPSVPLLLDAKVTHSQPQGYDSLPQAVLFSPVSQCNLNCVHCISRSTRAKLRFASQRTWDAIWHVTRGKKFVHLAMDYSGDILFDERRYPGTLAKVIALNAAFRIDTNANCLDDDLVDMLLSSQLNEINFSIDSMDPEVYPRIRRGSLPLPEVLAKITRFMSRLKTSGKAIRTVISFLLMRSTATTLKPALAFARENGIEYVNIVPMLAFTEDMLDEIFVWDEVAFAALHQELTTEAERVGVKIVIDAPVKRWREGDIHAPCEVPWGTAAILANGDVMACCMPGTVMGNLNKQSLAMIWNGREFAAFRKRVNSPDPPAPCRNCGVGTSRVRNNRKAYAPVWVGNGATNVQRPTFNVQRLRSNTEH